MPIRKPNHGIVQLRRSGAKQETSLEKQLNWALKEAKNYGVQINGTAADLAHMQADGLSQYKDLHLDDAKHGDNLHRLGLTSLIERATNDKQVSHVFALKRDRLARPKNAAQMVAEEANLLSKGITLVFSDGVLHPAESGEVDAADLIRSILDYDRSYKFLVDHSQQMIFTQIELAVDGYAPGGRPPYGFVRALYNEATGMLEKVQDGRYVKAKGCHVIWVPGDTPEDKEKLRVWLKMLDLKDKGWGNTKIANWLNEEGIPSPDAGKTRTKNGIPYVVDGKWSQGTVRSLLNNKLIAGIFEVGKTSEGKHRRTGPDGPRYLDDADRTSTGKLRKIRNPQDAITTGPTRFDPLIDPEKFERIQKKIADRDCHQTGVPKCKTPDKYPLACRLIDLNCGSLMYGRPNSGRLLYACSSYMRTNGAECDNNSVDAEAMLKFVMSTVRDQVEHLGVRELLEQKIRAIAEAEAAADGGDDTDQAVAYAEAKVQQLLKKIDVAVNNMMQETSEKLKERMRAQFEKMEQELSKAEADLAEALQAKSSRRSMDEEVAAAMQVFDDIVRVTDDPDARQDIQPLMNDLGLHVGLNFVEAIKGKKRKVRKLASGVIAFDNTLIDPEPDCGDGRHGREDSPVDRCETTPTSASRSAKRHPESVSFTKGNRGGQI